MNYEIPLICENNYVFAKYLNCLIVALFVFNLLWRYIAANQPFY